MFVVLIKVKKKPKVIHTSAEMPLLDYNKVKKLQKLWKLDSRAATIRECIRKAYDAYVTQ